jgi:hypothetical protein
MGFLQSKGKACASVGIALSTIRGRRSCFVQSPRRCAFVGPAGGRFRKLLLNIMVLEMVTRNSFYQVSGQVLHGGYASDPSSTGTASSSEGNLALGSGGTPASEQAVVDPNAGKDCRPFASQI